MQEESLSITENAAKRIAVLRQAQGNDSLKLRVSISSGGCSGFSYSFSLDDHIADEDHIIMTQGVEVVVDEPSLGLLAGSVIDYKTDLMGSSFVVENPNATSTCGCGTSFSA